ncbi:MAG: DUF4258 domain-containing protein [archaeon]
MQKGKYRIVIMRHALIRAMQRGVHPDLIEETLQTGTMKRFGKNMVRFEKTLRNGSIICVDEIIGDTIKIITIARRHGK